jgi:hypothetical protein
LPGLAGALADYTSLEVVGPFLVVWLIVMAALHEIAVRHHAGEEG